MTRIDRRPVMALALTLLAIEIAALAAPFPIAVTDDTGTLVAIAAEPQRIISLAPSHTEILYALGLGDRLVGVTAYCNHPPEATSLPHVGGFSDVDFERAVGLSPDLVFASTIHIAEVVPRLQALGITVFVIHPPTVTAVLDAILTVGMVTGRTIPAATLVAGLQARIDAVLGAIDGATPPTVFWELGPDLYTAGPGSFVDDLIRLAGGANIAADALSQWPQLSVEAIVIADPEIVVLADHNYGETADRVAARPGWAEIAAVAAGRVVELTDDDIFSRPGPRIVDALEFLARQFHPDRF